MSPFHSTAILLVEDNLADVRLTVELLREAKLSNRLTVVRDGVEALRQLRDDAERDTLPDLVLLDLDLPGLDGRTLLAEVRADPRLRGLPVFILTSGPSHDQLIREDGLLADGYMTKPIDLSAFVAAVIRDERFWLELVTAPAAAA